MEKATKSQLCKSCWNYISTAAKQIKEFVSIISLTKDFPYQLPPNG